MRLRWRLAQFFEIIWWRFYLRGKDKQDYLHKKKIYWHQLLQQCEDVFRIGEQNTILDMGCGPSGMYIIFPQNDITAVDPLLDKYEADLPLFSKVDYPNVAFIQSPIEQFVPAKKFDYVFCMNAINHVSNIAKGFEVLASCGAEKGKIIVTIDAHNNTFMKAIFRIGPGDVLHPHQYDLQEYTGFLEQVGYKVIKTICQSRGFVFSHYILIAEPNTQNKTT